MEPCPLGYLVLVIMKRHITILTSPSGEEFFEAYGPMTKSRSEATVFYTNEKTVARPTRFGGNTFHRPFWPSEIEAERTALREYEGWTFYHEDVTAEVMEGGDLAQLILP